MQSVGAAAFQGKRVRFSAAVKTRELVRTAALWMRVDRPGAPASAFDNMQNRPIQGTTEWTRYAIVLDVAVDASSLSFGAFITGEGTIWLDDAKLEVVDASVPTTDLNLNARGLEKPQNLDFED